jgi:DNA-binding response OmpR family regulator
LDGLNLIDHLRVQGNALPVLVLSACAGKGPINGLDIGAEKYIAKPIRLPEPAARVRALVRCATAVAGARLWRGDLLVDTSTRIFSLGDRFIEFANRDCASREGVLMVSPNV